MSPKVPEPLFSEPGACKIELRQLAAVEQAAIALRAALTFTPMRAELTSIPDRARCAREDSARLTPVTEAAAAAAAAWPSWWRSHVMMMMMMMMEVR